VPLSARASIRFNAKYDSNKIDESDSHDWKHDEQRISPLRGIKIDCSEESENADDSIRFNPEFDSNEIDESDLHPLKHDEPTRPPPRQTNSFHWPRSLRAIGRKIQKGITDAEAVASLHCRYCVCNIDACRDIIVMDTIDLLIYVFTCLFVY
jgi:hypothetical protein